MFGAVLGSRMVKFESEFEPPPVLTPKRGGRPKLPPEHRRPDPTRQPRTSAGPGRPRKDGSPAGSPRQPAPKPPSALQTAAAAALRARARASTASPPAPSSAPVGPFAKRDVVEARLARRETETMRLSEDELKQRAETSAGAIATLASRPELRFLERAERLAWLCAKVANQHFDTEVRSVSVGEGVSQLETIEVPTETPNFKAMDMLMKALGDYSEQKGEAERPPVTVVVAMSDLHEELGRRLAAAGVVDAEESQ